MNNDHLNKTNNPVNMASLSGVLTVFIGLGIIFIGVREFAYPSSGAEGFGVPLLSSSDSDLLAIKAARDVASGILLLTFLALHERRFLAHGVGVLTLIPLLDGLIVLRHSGWMFAPVILIHWGTAALMLVIVELLRRGK